MPAESAGIGSSTPDLDVKVDDIDATAVNHVTTVATSNLHGVQIDARNNPGEDVYVRIYNSSSVTVGDDDAEVVLPCRKGTTIEWWFPPFGIPFTTGISLLACKDKGGAPGSLTSPSGVVNVRMLIDTVRPT